MKVGLEIFFLKFLIVLTLMFLTPDLFFFFEISMDQNLFQLVKHFIVLISPLLSFFFWLKVLYFLYYPPVPFLGGHFLFKEYCLPLNASYDFFLDDLIGVHHKIRQYIVN